MCTRCKWDILTQGNKNTLVINKHIQDFDEYTLPKKVIVHTVNIQDVQSFVNSFSFGRHQKDKRLLFLC